MKAKMQQTMNSSSKDWIAAAQKCLAMTISCVNCQIGLCASEPLVYKVNYVTANVCEAVQELCIISY